METLKNYISQNSLSTYCVTCRQKKSGATPPKKCHSFHGKMAKKKKKTSKYTVCDLRPGVNYWYLYGT